MTSASTQASRPEVPRCELPALLAPIGFNPSWTSRWRLSFNTPFPSIPEDMS